MIAPQVALAIVGANLLTVGVVIAEPRGTMPSMVNAARWAIGMPIALGGSLCFYAAYLIAR